MLKLEQTHTGSKASERVTFLLVETPRVQLTTEFAAVKNFHGVISYRITVDRRHRYWLHVGYRRRLMSVNVFNFLPPTTLTLHRDDWDRGSNCYLDTTSVPNLFIWNGLKVEPDLYSPCCLLVSFQQRWVLDLCLFCNFISFDFVEIIQFVNCLAWKVKHQLVKLLVNESACYLFLKCKRYMKFCGVFWGWGFRPDNVK